MAVRIDIPGVGQVEADNAASEETLQAILSALDKSSGKKGKADEEAADAAKNKADADKKATKASKEFNVGLNSAADGAVKALKNIGLTAVSMVTNFATNFADIANNPIKETAKMLDTLVDATAKTATSLTDAIPVVGGFISAMINATAELAKAANKTFAEQLQKNIDTLQAYNKAGVSFAGSMNEMNTIAHGAGMSLVDLSKIVVNSKETLNKLGMAGGEAAAKLGGAMGVAAKQTNKAGLTLRDEMFKMGYSYEEQGAIFASYMANQAAAGKLRSMNDKQVAEETRKYATDLKVISDLTGQDAKKLIERQRAETMRGSLLNKLDADSKDAFIKGSSLLGSKSKEAAAALTQYLAQGKITDPKIMANKAMRDMVMSVGDAIKKGDKNILDTTQHAMANAANTISTTGANFADATDRALINGVQGMGSDIAQVSNEFMSNMATATPDPDAAKKSAAANENQATKADQLADSTSKLYAQTKNYEVEMETIVNKHLPKYAELLADINRELQGNFMKFINGKGPTKEEVQQQVKKEGYKSNAEGIGASSTIFLKQEDETQEAYAKRMTDYANARNKAAADAKKAESGDWQSDYMKSVTKHDKGGTIGAGGMGIAGENGPELISGPSSVLSTASTDSLIKAIDAMREMKGVRFGENGFEAQVGMNEDRMAKLKDRAKGFEGLDYKQLQEEFMKRPEAEPIKRAMKQMDDDERGDAMAETNTHLAEIAKLMKQNVNQTAKVAANTN